MAKDEGELDMDFKPNARDCKHGQLARSCYICELEQEVTNNSRAMTDDERKAYRELKSKRWKPIGNWYQDVKAFHEKFGCYIGKRPEFPPDGVTALRTELVLEEFKELVDAMKAKDIEGTAHELADVIYVLIGWAVSLGIPLDKMWNEVHRANMAKEGGTSREDGKFIKPADHVPADDEVIYKCRYCKDQGFTETVIRSTGAEHHPTCDGYNCGQFCPIPVEIVEVIPEPCNCEAAHTTQQS
jgi:predicted HAD superfamily Cof-like phosphohydrolase